MYRSRVIPCLLLDQGGLYKTIQFDKPRYLGDPINTMRLFNEKESDELIVLDISASKRGEGPNFDYIKLLTRECFMPICYGGGISSINQIDLLFKLGVEKIAVNSSLFNKPELIQLAMKNFGSQSIVASIDVKKNMFGSYMTYITGGTKNTKIDPVQYAKRAEELGVGEILLTSIEREGTMKGYDLELIQKVSAAVSIPVIANGGAGSLIDCVMAVKAGASAAAAGSLFVFYGKLHAVLINYPSQHEMKVAFSGS